MGLPLASRKNLKKPKKQLPQGESGFMVAIRTLTELVGEGNSEFIGAY